MVKLVSTGVQGDNWPDGGLVLEHIADQPMRFDSKKSLIQYCNKHKLSSGALL